MVVTIQLAGLRGVERGSAGRSDERGKDGCVLDADAS
jgi:hypothetical protein